METLLTHVFLTYSTSHLTHQHIIIITCLNSNWFSPHPLPSFCESRPISAFTSIAARASLPTSLLLPHPPNPIPLPNPTPTNLFSKLEFFTPCFKSLWLLFSLGIWKLLWPLRPYMTLPNPANLSDLKSYCSPRISATPASFLLL